MSQLCTSTTPSRTARQAPSLPCTLTMWVKLAGWALARLFCVINVYWQLQDEVEGDQNAVPCRSIGWHGISHVPGQSSPLVLVCFLSYSFFLNTRISRAPSFCLFSFMLLRPNVRGSHPPPSTNSPPMIEILLLLLLLLLLRILRLLLLVLLVLLFPFSFAPFLLIVSLSYRRRAHIYGCTLAG